MEEGDEDAPPERESRVGSLLGRAIRTLRDGVSVLPTAILTRYWTGAWRNAGQLIAPNTDATAQHIALDAAQLEQAEGEIYQSFKSISFVYAYHGQLGDLTTDTAKYKLSADERDYIGLQQDDTGNVTGFLDGSTVVGYINDEKTGARAVALKDAVGKVTIAIAGGALPGTSGYPAFKATAGAVFASTAGNMTAQFAPIYRFAKQIEAEQGHVDEINGHSLGAAVAECLVPAFPSAAVHLFDAPGLSPALEKRLSRFYGQSADALKACYHQQNAAGDYKVKRVRVADNSYNTVGWIPADISLTDPALDTYKGSHIAGVVPAQHFYGSGYYSAIRALGQRLNDGQVDLYNNDVRNDRSSGPPVITGAELLLGGGVVAIPVVGPILTVAGVVQGAVAHGKDNPKPAKPAQGR